MTSLGPFGIEANMVVIFALISVVSSIIVCLRNVEIDVGFSIRIEYNEWKETKLLHVA